MVLRWVEHRHTELLVRLSEILSLDLVLVALDLAVEVAQDGLNRCGWSQWLSVSEARVLVRWDHRRRSQLLQALSARATVAQAAQVVVALNHGSFPLDLLADLRRVNDAQVRMHPVVVLLL